MGKRAKSAKGAKHTNTTTQCWRTWRVHRTIYWERGYANLSKVLQGFLSRPRNNFKKIQLHSMGENSFLLSCIQFCGGTYCGGMSWRKRSDQERPIRSGISPKAPKYIRKLTFYPLLRGKSYIKKILDREPDITPHGLSRIWSPPEGAKQEIHR